MCIHILINPSSILNRVSWLERLALSLLLPWFFLPEHFRYFPWENSFSWEIKDTEQKKFGFFVTLWTRVAMITLNLSNNLHRLRSPLQPRATNCLRWQKGGVDKSSLRSQDGGAITPSIWMGSLIVVPPSFRTNPNHDSSKIFYSRQTLRDTFSFDHSTLEFCKNRENYQKFCKKFFLPSIALPYVKTLNNSPTLRF